MPKKSKQLCRGCYNDFYNQGGGEGRRVLVLPRGRDLQKSLRPPKHGPSMV